MGVFYVSFDGEGESEPDEFVAIWNLGDEPVDLAGWTLSDNANHVYTFPAGAMIDEDICYVYTNEDHPEECAFNWGSGSAIWNNDGDCATLRNAAGVEIDQECY